MVRRVNLIAPINNLGYGLFALGYARELAKFTDIELKIYPIKDSVDKSALKVFDIRPYLDTSGVIETGPDHVHFLIWHNPGEFGEGLKVLSTHFEVTPAPAFDTTKVDKIGVSSQWAVKALEDIAWPNVQYCPGPVLPIELYTEDRTNNLKEKVISLAGMPKDTIVFSSSGKFEKRKGHHRLIAAIDATQLPILLITTWQNPFVPDAAHHYLISQEWKFCGDATYLDGRVSVFENSYGAKVVCFPKVSRYSEVLDLYAIADIHLAISAGEGWDMPAVEHMALGIPTVLSENTAHLEYIPRPGEPHFVLECEKEEAFDGQFFTKPGQFWEPVKMQSLIDTLAFLSVQKKAHFIALGIANRNMAQSIHDALPGQLRSLLNL